MSKLVLEIENLSKKFCRNLKRSLWYGVNDLAGEMFLRSNERTVLRKDEFWALKDISFKLYRGETLGLIGANGAGKSTLLKLINGLIRPDTGSARIWGRVGALIELGMGFNPILTGRENIYVNAAVLGLRRGEVDRLLKDIIDFAEIGDFIDAPLRIYSSGMKVRLGFSVAANLNPDILLIDEILSVGDSSFRERCSNHLVKYKENGGSIIFVSHNTLAVESICDRVIWIDKGVICDINNPSFIIEKYEQDMLEKSRQAAIRLNIENTVASNTFKHLSVVCKDISGNNKDKFDFAEPFNISINYEAVSGLKAPFFGIGIKRGLDPSHANISRMSMLWDDYKIDNLPLKGTITCFIKNPPLSPGPVPWHSEIDNFACLVY